MRLVPWIRTLLLGASLLLAGCSTVRLQYRADGGLNPGPDGTPHAVRVRIFQLATRPVLLKETNPTQLYEGDGTATLGKSASLSDEPSFTPGSADGYTVRRVPGADYLLIVPVFLSPDTRSDWWALVRLWPFSRRVRIELRPRDLALPKGQRGWTNRRPPPADPALPGFP